MPANWKEQDIRDKQSVRSNQKRGCRQQLGSPNEKGQGPYPVDKSPAFCITKTSGVYRIFRYHPGDDPSIVVAPQQEA